MATPSINVMASRATGNQRTSKVSIDTALMESATFGTSGAATLAAAGTSLATGTPIPQQGFLKFTGGDGTKGLTLPSTGAGALPICAWNSSSGTCAVYPNTSTGTINGGSAGAALSMLTHTSCWFIPIDGTDDWFSVPIVPS